MEIDGSPGDPGLRNALEAAEELLRQAKVDISTLKTETQSLEFHPWACHRGDDEEVGVEEDIRLVELNAELLKHIEDGGE